MTLEIVYPIFTSLISFSNDVVEIWNGCCSLNLNLPLAQLQKKHFFSRKSSNRSIEANQTKRQRTNELCTINLIFTDCWMQFVYGGV